MKYEVVTIPPFEKQLKHLSRKYPSIKEDLRKIGERLSENPFVGQPLGNNCFKIRINISSKVKGKSGGGRIITHIYNFESKVFLLTIYDKSEKADLTDSELKELLKHI